MPAFEICRLFYEKDEEERPVTFVQIQITVSTWHLSDDIL